MGGKMEEEVEVEEDEPKVCDCKRGERPTEMS